MKLRNARLRTLAATLLSLLLVTSVAQFVGPSAGAVDSTPDVNQFSNNPAIDSTGVPPSIASILDKTPPAGRDLEVLTKATIPGSVPGGSSNFFVVVSNAGTTAAPASSPTTLTMTISTGMTFNSITDLSGTSLAGVPAAPTSGAGDTWICGPGASSSEETCTWGTGKPGAVVAGPIPGQSSVAALVELRVDQNFAATDAGVEATFSVAIHEDGNQASATSASAHVLVAKGSPSPDFFPDFSGTPSIGVGEQATEVVRVLNVGSGVASATSSEPSLKLSNLLPDKVLGDWDAKGSNWSCSGAPTAPPTCVYGAANLPVGALTSVLTLAYHLNPTAVADLHLQPGAEPNVQRWNIGLSGHSAGRPLTQTYQNQISVTPSQGSSLTLEASVSGGLDQLVPGSATSIDARLTNIGAAATEGRLSVQGTLPAGITLRGAANNMLDSQATLGSTFPWSCVVVNTSDYVCTPTGTDEIAAGTSTMFVLNLDTNPTAAPANSFVSMSASAENQISTVKVTPQQIPLFVLKDNAGFPALLLYTATGDGPLTPATDGAPASVLQGGKFSERLDVTDAGGAPITRDSKATITQTFGPGVKFLSVDAPSNEKCDTTDGKTPSLHCSVDFTAPLQPRGALTGPTVVLDTQAATGGTANWNASVRLEGVNAPPASNTVVGIDVGARAPELVAAIGTVQLPSAGGYGTWKVRISNSGDASSPKAVRVAIHLPARASNAKAQGPGLSCSGPKSSAAGVLLTCSSAKPIPAAVALKPILVKAMVPSNAGNKPFVVRADVTSGAAPAGKAAQDSMTVVVRNAIKAVIKVPDAVVFDDRPLTSLAQPIAPSTITLEGDGSGGNDLGLTYTWVQRCLTAADVAASKGLCKAVTPKVSYINQPAGTTTPHTPDIEFSAPPVKSLSVLVFQLSVSDGSATASSTARVKIVPPTPASKGFDLDKAHPTKMASAGPASETTKLPSPADQLRLSNVKVTAPVARSAKTKADYVGPTSTTEAHAVLDARHFADGNTGAPTTVVPASESSTTSPSNESSTTSTPSSSTSSTSPTPSGTETSTTEVATSTSSTTTTTTIPAGIPKVFCDLIKSAVNGQGFSTDVPGGITISFNNISLSGQGCNASSSISFSDSSIKIGSLLSATGVSGSVDSSGIHFTKGTLTGPSDWNSPSFSFGPAGVSGSAGVSGAAGSLQVAYTTAGGFALSGSVTGNGLVFLPLPSGWAGSTTLSFSLASAGSSFGLTSNATGPARDASPNSPTPTISLNGSVKSDGTFSVTASLNNFIQLSGSAINLSGTIARTTASGAITKSLTGTLASPIQIVKGLTLASLTATVAPTATSLGLTASGQLNITTGSSTYGVAVNLSYTDPSNWSLTAAGTGTSTWSPINGLTIKPSDIHGSISAVNDKYQFSLTFAPQAPFTPKSGVTITNLTLSLSNVCPDSGAACPTDASLFLQAGGNVSFNLPVVGTLSSTIKGVLALPTGAFSIEAALTAPVSLGGGVTINSAKVQINKGMPTPTGEATPVIDTQDSTGLSVSLSGSVTVPTIGTLPTVVASWSSSGWVMATSLGNYSLPGASGAGTALKNTVLGWASFKTSLNVTDPVTKLVTSIPLPANTFEVSGSYDAPDWFKTLFKLSSNVQGRATGQLNTSTGDFALKMSIQAAPDWFLYGSTSSSTSIRLTSVDFSIEKKAGDFGISLGGGASLIAPGVPTTSPLQLGIQLGFAASTATVSGAFTLTSKNGWQNAFGVSGLTLNDFALAFSINLSTLTPAVGIGATAVLPPTIRDPLGMPNGVKTTVVANISLTNPCLAIEVNDPTNSGQNVLNIGSGAFTAKLLDIEIAPSGCTVGQFHYDPGISLNFDGAILGVSLTVAATMKVSPFSLNAKIDVGSFSVAGLVVNKTSIAVAVDPKSFSLAFSGGVSVLGSTISVSGSYATSAGVSTIDLHGSLDSLVIGTALTIKNAKLDVHVVTGNKPTVQFAASGSIDLLGSTVDGSFKLNLDNGQLVEVTAAIKANIKIGGANGVVIDGTFNLDYGPAVPFKLDAKANVSVSGYQLADAIVHIDSNGFNLTADFSIGGVFSAKLQGTMYNGTVAAGTKITGPNASSVAAQAGDFLFSAKDVTINLGGFSSKGSVIFGRAGGTTWGEIGTTIQLLGSASGNSIAIKGSFASNGDFSLSGSGNLSLLGLTASVKASVAKTGKNVAVSGATTLSVLGTSVAFSGDFASNNGSPQFRLTGSANLSLGGFNFASAKFFYSNFPNDAGLAAQLNAQLGSVLTLDGRLSVESNGAYYLGVNASLNLRILTTTASVVLTNKHCAPTITYQEIKLPGFSIRMPIFGPQVCTVGGTTLVANASFGYGGFSFGIAVNIASNGDFKATASSPASGTFNGDTSSLYLAVVAFYAHLSYQMSITVQNTYPYLSLSGSGSGDIYGRTWDIGFWYARWGGWHQLIGISASITTAPSFRICGSARVWGVSFGPACFGH